MKEYLPIANQYADHRVRTGELAVGQATVLVLVAGQEIVVKTLCVIRPVTMVGPALHRTHATVLLAGKETHVIKLYVNQLVKTEVRAFGRALVIATMAGWVIGVNKLSVLLTVRMVGSALHLTPATVLPTGQGLLVRKLSVNHYA